MICRSGDDSPTPVCEKAEAVSQEVVGILSSNAVCVSPKSVTPLSDCTGRAVSFAVDIDDNFVAPAEGDDVAVVPPALGASARLRQKAPDPVLPGPVLLPGRGPQVADSEYDDDGAVIFDGGCGEARDLRLPPGVPTPNREMVRKHRASGHCPYRAWCSHCISGAANAPAHRARCEEPLGDVPELHSDYGFFRDKKGDKKNTVTVLVTKDRRSNGVCAHVVPRKGAGGGFAVKQYLRDIKKFGHHHKILIRSDGENAIKDLMNKVSALRASESTILENSPAGDSRANGRAERAVQSIEKQVRVLKLAVEEHLGRFSVTHKAFSWLVMHAADVLTKFHVDGDGATAFEKIKGRAYSGVMYEFGQCILYKTDMKVQGGNMQPRWAKGVWLGKRFATEEHVVATTEGVVVRSAAVRPHPECEYDSHVFDAIVGVPWDPTGKNADLSPEEVQEHLKDLPRVVAPRPEAEYIPPSRRAVIKKEYVERFGPTPNCAKCRAIIAGDNSTPTLGHSEGCRTRMGRLLMIDPELSKSLERAQIRQDEFLARRVEAGDI